MHIRSSLLRLSVMLALVLPGSAHAFSLLPSELPETPLTEWQTMRDDALVVDTKNNIGYLVHRDGGYLSFPVATGQKRVVRYIGRTYNAATPNRFWVVEEKTVKGDRTTFGKEGLFLRLFDEDGRTAYGIHSHRSIDVMLAEADRYRSMGCVLVSQVILDLIEDTYEGNGGRLEVTTTATLGDGPVTYMTLKERIDAPKEL